ncbi:hypothetical protein B484DRAFT_169190 [Ochromonadaceae sp. CCMP2298]|nr:hypothetical protein B484DRAFT_169190 [Ochromonadaceae sp. CCMP2298]
MDPVAKRIGRLRALVAVMLIGAAVIVGVSAYVGGTMAERNTAVDKFKGKVELAVSKLDANFKNMDDVMRLMAQMYTDLKVDWPTAALPNFYSSAPLAKNIGKAENIALVTLVKPEDVSRYEAFMFDYWDSEPAIPPGKAAYYSAVGDRGIWALNDTTNGIEESSAAPYHDITGHTTWGDEKRIGAISQVLFTGDVPANFLGYNLYSVMKQGEAIDRLLHCVEDSSFKSATEKCGSTIQMSTSSETLDYAVKTDTGLKYIYSHRSVPVVVGDGSSHEMVGLIGTQYSWGPVLSRIFSENVSGNYPSPYNPVTP